jgi:DNA mismatch endonuclease (patch repair protein)
VKHPRWLDNPPPAEVLRSPPTRNERVAEQDTAAGGREVRLIQLLGGDTATASTLLHRPQGRRIYAYLRYKHAGRNHRFYVGEVTARTRAEALRRGWKLAREKGLVSCEAD